MTLQNEENGEENWGEAMEIGRKIQDVLDDKDITQTRLAEQLNIPLSTLNGYMTGRRAFPLEILRDIAVVLQVTMDYLLGISSSAEQPMELKHSEEELIKAYRGLKKDQRELIYQNIQFMKQQNQR